MNVRRYWIAFIFCLLPAIALGQGFGGLGTGADGFAVPKRRTILEFPRDHAMHPNFRIEWWYLTANLKGADGEDYGVQWTLFRSALKPGGGTGWSSPNLWMGHAAITSKTNHVFSEVRARGGIGQAGVSISPFNAWIDDWQMKGSPRADGAAGDELSDLSLSATGENFSFELKLAARGPLVLQGDRGYSTKSESGSASYYYSQPFYQAAGTLELPDGPVSVTGTAWLDREWSSQPLAADQHGWDWVSLHLNDGSKLMGFQLRQENGDTYTSATLIDPQGNPEPLEDGAIEFSPLANSDVNGKTIPTSWRIKIPGKGLELKIAAINSNAWMATSFPYWEGPVKITSDDGKDIGRGYLEMTGY